MEVREDTWGHLAPKPRRKYKGTILIAESEFGGQGRCIIRADFPGLESSPWSYDSMQDYVYGLDGLEDGNLYLWSGTFEFFKGKGKHFDEGSFRYIGSVRLVRLDCDG